MVRLAPLTVATCLALIPAALGVDYPVTIEVDLIFPRNATYNNMTSFPIWEFVWLGGDEDEQFLSTYTGPTISNSIYRSDFRYTHEGSVIAAGQLYSQNGYSLRPGTYFVQWTYDTATCSVSDDTITFIIDLSGAYITSGGNVVFTVVSDGSGLDFEIPVDECPLYSGHWSADDGTDSCPDPSDFDVEPDPCKVQLGQEQIDCLQDWYRGNNESEACMVSLDRWDESGAASPGRMSAFSASLAIWFVALAVGTF
ncbi:hypothetical protein BJX61DRAFT_531497 [Aspergillus egyptiacus]|nr:hypothetical protein BJX61DRAFT_531497 [Aspergillus egyptiacus]